MITNFETSKKLAQYVWIPASSFYENDGEFILCDDEPLGKEYIISHKCTPAPTLEELLKVCPITIDINCSPFGFIVCTPFKDRTGKHIEWTDECAEYQLKKSSNLSQAVAEIMLQYYKEQGK